MKSTLKWPVGLYAAIGIIIGHLAGLLGDPVELGVKR